MLKIPPKIQYVLNVLHQNGYEAYIVGGCVRDALLGINPHDYDITTSAKPEEVMNIFERTIPTGIKHGTVTVIVEKEPVEVTTFRTEGSYSDSRRPDSVEFVTNLEEDLSRRDFTVNAIAFNPKDGLQDYFNSKKDLDNKLLRAVGDPEKRFREDALRILRLFRFASQLGFEIEENTFFAALKLSPTLKNISRERIFTELLKAITGKNPAALKPLLETNALDFLSIDKIPDFSLLAKLPQKENLRLFTFLWQASDEPLWALYELKGSNEQKRYVNLLWTLSELPFPKDKPALKNALAMTDINAVKEWLSLLKAMGNDTERSENLLTEILEKREPYLISHLAVTGLDLKSLGYSGKELGTMLETLRQAVINEPQKNSKEILLKLLYLL